MGLQLLWADSSMFCQQEVILSQQGVQQGDPLGPLFFALAWHPVAEAIQRVCPNTWTSFYLDDGHLVGPLDELVSAMQLLHDQGTALGVLVNLAKCWLWHPSGGSSGWCRCSSRRCRKWPWRKG